MTPRQGNGKRPQQAPVPTIPQQAPVPTRPQQRRRRTPTPRTK